MNEFLKSAQSDIRQAQELASAVCRMVAGVRDRNPNLSIVDHQVLDKAVTELSHVSASLCFHANAAIDCALEAEGKR